MIRQLDGIGDGQFDDCWDVLEREHARYERLAKSMCRNHPDLIGELMSEAYERAPQIAETWDPTIGSLAAHLHSSIVCYMWKYMNKRERLIAREGGELDVKGLPEASAPSGRRGDQYHRQREEQEARDEVVFLRAVLTPLEMWLLEARHVKGYTYEVIADLIPLELGGPISNAAARKAYASALIVAQELLACQRGLNANG